MTVVVATYGRPDALRCALESVVLQSVQRWRVIVVADVDPDARATVNGLADNRLRFVDLPTRQGEQSRPNSVGMRLASTPFVALLNHDDLWLPDHLERALGVLGDDDTSLYASSAAFARAALDLPDGTRPVFTERTPLERRLDDAY